MFKGMVIWWYGNQFKVALEYLLITLAILSFLPRRERPLLAGNLTYVTERNLVTLSLQFCSQDSTLRSPI